jgi:hypothetical protein
MGLFVKVLVSVPVACALWVCSSAAQTPSPPHASADEIVKAKAQADAIIAQGAAQQFFVNITDGGAPKVRHVPSGMECVFDPIQPGSVRVYQSTAAPGDDVSCGIRIVTKDGHPIQLTQYATRYPQAPTVDQILSGTLASIRVHMTDLKPAAGPFNNLQPSDATAAHKSFRLDGVENGQRVFTRASASVVRGWTISQRITSGIADAQVADVFGEMTQSVAAEMVARAKPPEGEVTIARVSAAEAAGDEVRRLLRGVRNPSDFKDLTANGAVALQHLPSGAICRFGLDTAHNVLSSGPAGIACRSAGPLSAENLEIVYAPQMPKAEVDRLMAAALAQFDHLEPLAEQPGSPSRLDRVVKRFSASAKTGPKIYIRSVYAQAGNWAVFQRTFANLTVVALTDQRADQQLTEIIDQINARQAQVPAGPQPKGSSFR